MFARVETFTASPDEMDQLVTAQHHTVGLVRTMTGNMGGYVLVDRASGQLMNVTFWQSEEDEAAAEADFDAAPVRGRVGHFAVAMQEALGAV